MSLAQFIQLHLLEAKNGESVELWMALWTMGYNHNLKPDESFNFKVSVLKYSLNVSRTVTTGTFPSPLTFSGILHECIHFVVRVAVLYLDPFEHIFCQYCSRIFSSVNTYFPELFIFLMEQKYPLSNIGHLLY